MRLGSRSNWQFAWHATSRRPYRPPGRIVLFRLKWETGIRMTKGWHDNKLSVSICKRWFQFEREYKGWLLTILGIRVHIGRAYGGHYPRIRN